jgi:hypothetical protein
MRNRPLRVADVLALRRLVARGGAGRVTALHDAMQAAAHHATSPRALHAWHDLLLFVLAHPRDAAEHAWATAALDALGRVTARHAEALASTGIEGTPVEGTWSLALVRWLAVRWPGQVALASVSAPPDALAEVLRLLVLAAEREALDQPAADADALLAAVLGTAREHWLRRLLGLLDRLPDDEAQGEPLRAALFDRLGVVVRVAGSAANCSLTRARAPAGAPFVHPAGLRRDVEAPAILAERTGPPVRLGAAAARGLVDTARAVLAVLGRETDPVTHAGAVELHDLGRGLRVALFHLDVAHRLPFDSYVGFMAFRNGVPLAYGGAWVFPGRSKVGLNVFEAQRGGESAWAFAQILRLYRWRFGVPCFEAEHYQLGLGNPEGMRSGAYWFYWRLGFRPAAARLARVAAREAARLARDPAYRTPSPLLRDLVAAGLELRLAPVVAPILDTAALTVAVQRHVAARYDGDRTRALEGSLARLARVLPADARRGWSATERQSLALWAVPLDLVDDLEAWPMADRRRLALLVRAKGAPTETQHQRLLARHGRLLAAWGRTGAG